jgi:hypothetical protein
MTPPLIVVDDSDYCRTIRRNEVHTERMASLVMATDYRVRDYDHWWSVMQGGRDGLAAVGVRHYVVYRALDDPQRVFVTVGLNTREPLDRILASPSILAWFDSAGVEEIPPIFVGTSVEKHCYAEDPPDNDERSWPDASVIVASVVRVSDFDTYRNHVHTARERSIAAGMRQFWIYRAVDDADEVMALQEIDTARHAQAWLRYPEAAAEFYRDAGVGVYPPVFVGTVAEVIDLGRLACENDALPSAERCSEEMP